MFKSLGTEEDYTQLDSLLDDLVTREDDARLEGESATSAERKRKQEGLKLRSIAMMRLKDKDKPEVSHNQHVDPLPAPHTPPDEGTPVSAKRRKSASNTCFQQDVISYMRERDERVAELRREELQIERMKAENQSKQLDLLLQQLAKKD